MKQEKNFVSENTILFMEDRETGRGYKGNIFRSKNVSLHCTRINFPVSIFEIEVLVSPYLCLRPILVWG